MKKLLYFLMSFLLLGALSCSSDDDDGDDFDGMSLRYKVDGVMVEADEFVIIGQSPFDEGYGLTVYGKSSNGSLLTLSMDLETEIGPGTYILANHQTNGGISYQNAAGITYIGGQPSDLYTVEVHITDVSGNGVNRKFKGNFSANLAGPTSGDELIITEGKFSSF